MIWFISCCFDLRNGKCYVELHNSVSAVCLFCPLCVFVLWFFVCLFVLCWAGVLCVGVCVYVSLCVCLFFLFLDGTAWQGELTIASVRARWSKGDYGVAGVAEGGIYLPFKNSIY